MSPIPAPTIRGREKWPDADFDLPEGHTIHGDTTSDMDDNEEDWNMPEVDIPPHSHSLAKSPPFISIARPQPSLQPNDDNDDEGASTIKASATVKPVIQKSLPGTIEEDFEEGLFLPSELTQLSLAPLTLNHRSSKGSLEWGDKDHTSSSQSSDAYSNLGLTNASSNPESETDEDESELEGLIIPSDVFDSCKGARHLTNLLTLKKAAVMSDYQVKVATPDPEDDFEMGLVIEDDADFSPSRLLSNTQQSHLHSADNRSKSVPPHQRNVSATRPSWRLRSGRPKSPVKPGPTASRNAQKSGPSPSPPLYPPSRSNTPSTAPSSFLSPRPGSLRGQKSHTGLNSPPTSKKISRKSSLSSLMGSSNRTSGSSVPSSSNSARYEEPTTASRAKSHKASMSRVTQDYKVPPTRPSTPSTSTAALRLTVPTTGRLKSRPTLSAVFGSSGDAPIRRTASPLPPRPASTSKLASHTSAPKVLRRPKRLRTYGDGTELDGIEDLPTDRDKESRFRVQPKGHGHRIPGGSFAKSPGDTLRRKNLREGSSAEPITFATSFFSKRASKLDPSNSNPSGRSPPMRKKVALSTQTRPTLIRNLGGVGGPKVVGDMKWNPHTMRWEGNEQVLRDFDAVVASTRPALITHLTGSSIGSSASSFGSGARIVGNMVFDPIRLCWISTLPPEEDEPDVFANLADDEDDSDSWESKAGTIRASVQSNVATSSSLPDRSQTWTPSDCGSDRGSRGSMVFDIDDTFVRNCRKAEERHNIEIKGWKNSLSREDALCEPDRSFLYEIRTLATRKY
ncbi:uncharacterized protein BT62DRAFT_1001450 [Guyanagaster necrorhizus]|uniref:Protein byr4 n=1 Tax=Guyanagaster necrorhizus TaxID=856835 RepID=A0A9P8AWZ0_9AGAR|nr:uncharacterized protein BT62DRAFT_1001450 [Guyanagaster necrorhizus MCA 3950]KAG7450651.1 hypothetical protein BT62DRAFT_1001450 [Guyanagaster necrorhizus MCA 3950]